jgi:hypothetical protein
MKNKKYHTAKTVPKSNRKKFCLINQIIISDSASIFLFNPSKAPQIIKGVNSFV